MMLAHLFTWDESLMEIEERPLKIQRILDSSAPFFSIPLAGTVAHWLCCSDVHVATGPNMIRQSSQVRSCLEQSLNQDNAN